jgi:outer membrane protein assembly factor BamB
MIRHFSVCIFSVLLYAAACLTEPVTAAAQYWPQWRGPLGTGEAPDADPPVRWDEKTNIRWKIPLPGLSHATPVVWKDRIFVLAAVPAAPSVSRTAGMFDTYRTSTPFRYEILAFRRKDGSLLWRRTAKVAPPHEGIHVDASWASCSPVTDGEHVIVSFGSRGVYCYDMDGNLKWERDFGEMRIRYQYGESTSPVLSGDRLIIQWDSEACSFLAVLDKRSGKEIWRKDRNDGTSWATPLVVEHRGKKQVIVVAIRRVRSYDLDTGAILWETRDMTAGPIPSPVAGNGIVYLMGAYLESILQAISLDKARGDAAASKAILWELDRDTSYVSTPLLYGGMLYFLKQYQNILSCFDAGTGRENYSRKRLDGLTQVYSSPVAAGGRIYITGRNGATIVLRHGPKFEVLATNRLDDRFDASPVIVEREIFLRGHENLYCIAAE